MEVREAWVTLLNFKVILVIFRHWLIYTVKQEDLNEYDIGKNYMGFEQREGSLFVMVLAILTVIKPYGMLFTNLKL
jgi:hypothetical protein